MAPARDPELRLASAALGGAVKGRNADLIRTRRRELAEAQLAAYIKKMVDAAPQLTNEQRDRLAILLRGGDAA